MRVSHRGSWSASSLDNRDEIAQHARRAGAGARLDVIVPKSTSADDLAAVDSLFAWLRGKGFELVVRRDEHDA